MPSPQTTKESFRPAIETVIKMLVTASISPLSVESFLRSKDESRITLALARQLCTHGYGSASAIPTTAANLGEDIPIVPSDLVADYKKTARYHAEKPAPVSFLASKDTHPFPEFDTEAIKRQLAVIEASLPAGSQAIEISINEIPKMLFDALSRIKFHIIENGISHEATDDDKKERSMNPDYWNVAFTADVIARLKSLPADNNEQPAPN